MAKFQKNKKFQPGIDRTTNKTGGDSPPLYIKCDYKYGTSAIEFILRKKKDILEKVRSSHSVFGYLYFYETKTKF